MMGVSEDSPCGCGRALNGLDAAGFSLREVVCNAALVVPPRARAEAILCLTIEGGYEVDWYNTRLRCYPASLLFEQPGQLAGGRISDSGSRCLIIAFDPAAVLAVSHGVLDVERLGPSRRAPPHWLAFQLRRELQLEDGLSSASIASTVIALFDELERRPALEVRSPPPPWLKRVQEQVDDEFHLRHTLEGLARTAGVHHVHLAREFRRRFGCTVGHLIRQRRLEVACHRLASSTDSLSTIALDVGFADQSHFSNTFRQLVGMAPRAFRARFGECRVQG